MSHWKDQIPGCFEPHCLVLAGTPTGDARARELKAEMTRTAIPRMLVEHAIEDWLHQQTSNTGQLYEQMARVRAFLDH